MSKGEETRREILGTALSLASQVGLEGLSIGLLASHVGMSKSGLFAHFDSKEQLQVAVLEEASRRFAELVVVPALRSPRGRPRMLALFQHWLAWAQLDFMPGGCIFMSAATELDDRPGLARDALVASQRDWQDTLTAAVRSAKREGHFRRTLSEEQLVFELFGIMASYYRAARLMDDEQASSRAHQAFERLMKDASSKLES